MPRDGIEERGVTPWMCDVAGRVSWVVVAVVLTAGGVVGCGSGAERKPLEEVAPPLTSVR